MKVKEVIEMLQAVDPELTVVFPSGPDQFESPCPVESGVIELGDSCDEQGNPTKANPEDPTKLFAFMPHVMVQDIELV